MRKALILFLLSLMAAFSFAATLTINPDGSGDYVSFTECFTALMADGISEPTDIEVAAGTYVESATINAARLFNHLVLLAFYPERSRQGC